MTISQTVERKYKNTKDKSLLFASDFSDYNQDYIGDLLYIYKVGQTCPSGKWCLSENHHYQVRPCVPQSDRDCRGNSKERPCTGADVWPRSRELFWTFHSDSYENRFPDEWFCQKTDRREHDH